MKIRNNLINKATDSEKRFYLLIKGLGLHFVFQKQYNRSNGKHYYPDFVFQFLRKQASLLKALGYRVRGNVQRHRIVVEIDGLYHQHTEAYDFQRQKEIEHRKGKIKYHFIRFTNGQVEQQPNEVLKQFKAFCKRVWLIDLNQPGIVSALLTIPYVNKVKLPIRETFVPCIWKTTDQPIVVRPKP